jgi:RNA-directed DNA polymerase
MSGDVHVRFRERLGGRFPGATRLVILCRDRDEAQAAFEAVRAWTQANGLTLHPEKTHIGDCREPGQGFEFLGYRFEAGRRWVRKKSRKALREAVRAKTRRLRSGTWCRSWRN